jgi:hypothetical protein
MTLLKHTFYIYITRKGKKKKDKAIPVAVRGGP